MKLSSEKRPFLKPVLSKTDYILEIAAIMSLLAIWIIPTVTYHYLPDTVPIHFGINGQADDWGRKSTIFFNSGHSSDTIYWLEHAEQIPSYFQLPG